MNRNRMKRLNVDCCMVLNIKIYTSITYYQTGIENEWQLHMWRNSIPYNTIQNNTLAYKKWNKTFISSLITLTFLELIIVAILSCTILCLHFCILCFSLWFVRRTIHRIDAIPFRMVHWRLWTIDRQIIGYNRASDNQCEKKPKENKLSDRRNNKKKKKKLPIKSCSSWSSLSKFSRDVTFRNI